MLTNSIIAARRREIKNRLEIVERLNKETATYEQIVNGLRVDEPRCKVEWEAAMKTCKDCTSYRSGQCGICGCLCRFKAIYKDWPCPKGEF